MKLWVVAMGQNAAPELKHLMLTTGNGNRPVSFWRRIKQQVSVSIYNREKRT
jgi:hypothetical protein